MRSAVVGLAVAAALVCLPASGQAQGGTPRIKVARAGGHTTVTLTSGALQASQRLSTSSFALTLAAAGDEVRFAGDLEGRIVLQRAGDQVRIALASATGADMAAAARLLAGSTALASFDDVINSAWGRSDRNAALFAAAHAMLAAVQGRATAVQSVVRQMAASDGTASGGIRLVRQSSPMMCWRSYERDVIAYTYQLEACMEWARESWNPVATAFCAYEYNLKTSLAFIWLLDCHGY